MVTAVCHSSAASQGRRYLEGLLGDLEEESGRRDPVEARPASLERSQTTQRGEVGDL